MDARLARLIWPICIAGLLFYGVYLFWGAVQAQTAHIAEHTVSFSFYRDARGHHIQGILPVPSPCDVLQVELKATGPSRTHLVFTSRPESAGCPLSPEPRAFSILVPFTDSTEKFTASLNGEPLTLTLIAMEAR